MKKFFSLIALTALMVGFSTVASAHTPLCDCFDNGDGTVTCEGGFSDGSSAFNVPMIVKNADGKVLIEGKMSSVSDYTFDKPSEDYVVIFDAGEGHAVEINGADIIE